MTGWLVREEDHLDAADLVRLYDSVGWTTYTRDLGLLPRALAGSLRVVSARAGAEPDAELIGLARIVGDGATIAYLQDVLVDPRFHRRGVGRALVQAAFAPFADVRQHVLLTDDETGQRAFYQSLGFTEVRDLGEGRLRAFVRFG